MEQDDPQLIRRYLEGDEGALRILIGRHMPSIFNYVSRMVGNAHDAEDIAQDTFMKMWKHLKHYRQGESFKTWLFTIAHHSAIDWLRKRKPVVFSSFDTDDGGNALVDGLEDPEPLPDELVARAQSKGDLDTLLDELSPAYREVLMLHYFEHLTFDEIGKVLKKPLNTVKSQHRRALEQVRALLSRKTKA